MRTFNFSMKRGVANVVRIPAVDPGGTRSVRLLTANSPTGTYTVNTNATVSLDGDTAVVTIPSTNANSSKFPGWWKIEVSSNGTTWTTVTEGTHDTISPESPGVTSTEYEIANNSGLAIPVSLSDPVSISAGQSIGLAAGASVLTSSSLSKKVGDGKVFIAGSAISLGGVASAERASLQLVNPASSTKVLYIFAVTVYSSIAQQIAYMENSTMGGTPTALTPFNLNRASSETSLATASVSTGAPTGGVAWPNQSRVQADAPLNLSLPPLILPPGKSFLIRGTVGDAQVFTANAYWFEE